MIIETAFIVGCHFSSISRVSKSNKSLLKKSAIEISNALIISAIFLKFGVWYLQFKISVIVLWYKPFLGQVYTASFSFLSIFLSLSTQMPCLIS